MRSLLFATVAFLGLTALPVLAQTHADSDIISTSIRPGHTPGVGDSQPSSDKASNINATDTRSDIAPTLPQSSIGNHGTAREYLTAARASLVAGRTGQAQQSLEMAETRALDRVVPPDQTSAPSESAFITQIRDARQALGNGDSPHAIELIDRALAS